MTCSFVTAPLAVRSGQDADRSTGRAELPGPSTQSAWSFRRPARRDDGGVDVADRIARRGVPAIAAGRRRRLAGEVARRVVRTVAMRTPLSGRGTLLDAHDQVSGSPSGRRI